MKVTFRTNLDLIPADSGGWPIELPFRPQVGDFVSNNFEHSKNGYRLELIVVRVSYKEVIEYDSTGERFSYGNRISVEAELGLPPSRYETVRAFYNFYEKLTGSKFI